jgi:hypothetical protein
MSKVYVIQDTGKNLNQATRFGELEILSQRDAPLYSDMKPFADMIARKLTTFNAHKDYLLFIGDPVLIAMVGGIMVNLGHTSYMALKWDRQEMVYVAITIKL